MASEIIISVQSALTVHSAFSKYLHELSEAKVAGVARRSEDDVQPEVRLGYHRHECVAK